MESTHKKQKSLNNFKLFIRLGIYHQIICVLNVCSVLTLSAGPLSTKSLYTLLALPMHVFLILKIVKLLRCMNLANLKRLQNSIYVSIPVWILCVFLLISFTRGPAGGALVFCTPFICLFYAGLGAWIGSKKHVQDIRACEI